jgi:hypothetical protein
LLRHADAGIDDREGNRRSVADEPTPRVERDSAAPREFSGVAEQVEQDLTRLHYCPRFSSDTSSLRPALSPAWPRAAAMPPLKRRVPSAS